MKIEHVAVNVSDALSLSRWWVQNLGMTVKRRLVDAPYTHFLADDSGTVMLEVYSQDVAEVPDYRAQHPMTLHFAFESNDVAADAQRLVSAGAQVVGEVEELPNGDTIAMLRDPWGLCVQLVMRATPMV